MFRETSPAGPAFPGADNFPQPEELAVGTDELVVGFALTDVDVVLSDDDALHATASIVIANTSTQERSRTDTECPLCRDVATDLVAFTSSCERRGVWRSALALSPDRALCCGRGLTRVATH